MEHVTLYCGNCIDVLKSFDENSIDSIITDPPYGFKFMGMDWDNPKKETKSQLVKGLSPGMRQTTREENIKFQIWTSEWASECLRVAKPGATMFVFGGTRMFHRMTCGIEDSGWIVKDTVMWLYSQGRPKAMKIEGSLKTHGLKPSWEPVMMFMKPNEGTYLNNLKKYKIAGINVKEGKFPTNSFLSIEDQIFHDLLADKVRFFYHSKESHKFHPTAKPIELIEYLCSLTPGEVVLDPFMGSGTTGVACKRLGRSFIGIDLDKSYCEIAKQRISAENTKLKEQSLYNESTSITEKQLRRA